jgi:AraC family transcriptional regulator of adaptative response/methylated-DNA-[protein]-cysteine methyltransferase
VNDYERIANAIRFLDAERDKQPDLASVAAAVGLGPSHFHRMFVSWVGATPKDFLQCLTLSHAKELLKRGESVLDASLDAGLSGPGRLHDLCVTLEAATPGEIKSRGAGLIISAGVADTPFGNCLLAETQRGICHLSFFDEAQLDTAISELRAEWPAARLEWDETSARSLANRIFRDPPKPAAWKLHVRGTPFQLRVWRALLEIPSGSLASYGKIASMTGHPNASRATGTAVGRNTISYLIPCHRVIRETGICGNYRWGAIRKRAILAWESARITTEPTSAPF